MKNSADMKPQNKLLDAMKHLLSIGIPMATTRTVQSANAFITMAILAQLGHTVLAATFLIGAIRILTILIFMAPLFALGSILGRQFGAQKTEAIPSVMQQAWLTAILLSITPMVFLLFIGPILRLLHQPENVISVITPYFHIVLWSYPIVLVGTVNTQFLSAIKKQNWVLLISLMMLALTSFFCYGLTLGHFGFPKLGIVGAALSPIITNSLLLIFESCLVIHFIKPFGKLWEWQLAGFKWLKMTLKIGLPIGIQMGSNMIVIFFFSIMVGWLGESSMSAAQISGQYVLFILSATFGLSEAATITVGHAHGAKRFDRIHRIGMAGILLALIITLVIGLLFAIFHKPLAELFINFHLKDAQTIYILAMWVLLIRTIAMFFDGTSSILTGCLRGLYDTQFPMTLDILANWCLMVPVGALFAFGFDWGLIGLSIGAAITRLVNMIALLIRWQQKTQYLRQNLSEKPCKIQK